MRREDWSIWSAIAEAVCVILTAVYLILQIYYGMVYHVPVYTLILNIIIAILVYLALTLLAVYPERINHLPAEVCVGVVRRLSIRMVRVVKFVFVVGLMVPCVFDVIGIQIQDAYSVIVMALMFVVALYYEGRIIRILRNQNQ